MHLNPPPRVANTVQGACRQCNAALPEPATGLGFCCDECADGYSILRKACRHCGHRYTEPVKASTTVGELRFCSDRCASADEALTGRGWTYLAYTEGGDPVNHPQHYTAGRFEVIDVIEDWGLGFNLGNVVKYVARSSHKGTEIQDLEKAAWYLARRIAQLKADR